MKIQFNTLDPLLTESGNSGESDESGDSGESGESGESEVLTELTSRQTCGGSVNIAAC